MKKSEKKDSKPEGILKEKKTRKPLISKKAEKSEKMEKPKKPERAKKAGKVEKPKKPERAKKTEKPEKGEKVGVPFYRSLRVKLIVAFFVPVVCILVLGITSYQKASQAIVKSYKDSTDQTAQMMQQYLSLVVDSEKQEFRNYQSDSELNGYFKGTLTDMNEIKTYSKYVVEIRDRLARDSKLSSFYFLGDEGRSLYNGLQSPLDDGMTAYFATEQGKIVEGNPYEWFVFCSDASVDEAVGIGKYPYSLRIAHKFQESPVAVMIDLDVNTIRSGMQSLDPGEGGYVLLVDRLGNEYYSWDEMNTTGEPIVSNTEFFQRALESEETQGNEMVTMNGKEYLFVYNKMVGNVTIAALIPSSRMLAETADIKRLSVILTIVAILIASVLGTVIANNITKIIRYVLSKLRKVAKGDLTVHLSTKRKDEFAELCKGVNSTVEHVKELITDVNEMSEKVTSASMNVNRVAQTFIDTSADIQNSISEIKVGVNELDNGSEECLEHMDTLSGKITNVSTNADEIGKLTSSTGATISTGIQSVQGLTESANSTSEITASVIQAIQQLETKSRSINTITSAINDIAEQTNLLSLNASIEAARAGEAGRGFAVVAEEIRKLSDECLTSAGKITKIVNEIIVQTEEVAGIAKEAQAVVASQSDAVEETTASFRQIDQQVESLLEALATISSNVSEMNTSRVETLETIESISAVSAKTSACSTSVYTAVETQMGASKELTDAADTLQRRAGRLRDVLSTFTV